MKVEDRHTGVRVAVEVAREGEGEVKDRTNHHDCCTASSIYNHQAFYVCIQGFQEYTR